MLIFAATSEPYGHRRLRDKAPFIGRRVAAACVFALLLFSAASAGPVRAAENSEFAAKRETMIRNIVDAARLTRRWIGKPTLDPKVLGIMGKVPRHEFVPRPLVPYAYIDRPLQIGHGQTVSQPYIVALMTDLARIKRGDRVLLLGLGGGYHAAILERLAGKVYCVEMQTRVAEAALNRLLRLGYRNVEARNEDPYYGWGGGRASFDAIIVRQAMDFIPKALLNQLKPGGRLVIPAGVSRDQQFLTLAIKQADGRITERRVLPVRFTRMPGGPRI